MSMALGKYLDHVMIYANRKEEAAAKIRLELADHLQQRVAELEGQGTSSEDAVAQAIKAHGSPRTVGYGLRKGVALLDVRTEGTARGIVAIGPKAVGVIAFGNIALGLFAFGNVAVGVLAFGAFSLAAFLAVGGLCISPLGVALGLVVAGQGAFGLIACGGLAVGLEVPWAVDSVDLLSERGLQFFEHYRSATGNMATIGICLAIFMLFPLFNGIMCSMRRDEYRRIKKADPDIDVSVTWP